jgi:LPS O-antigen subunit length determinant protein (WzzB/FepE family)
MDSCQLRIEIFDADYLNIVELNTTGDNTTYVKGNSESSYMQSEVFNIFIKCFENSNRLYEFYGATKYDIRKIVPLKNELNKKLQLLQNISSLKGFKDHIQNIFLGNEFLEKLNAHYNNWENEWETYLNKLIKVNKGLINIVDKCLDEQRVLWVIGY